MLRSATLVFLKAVLLLGVVPSVRAQPHAAPPMRTMPDYLIGEELESASVYRRVLPAVVTITTSSQVITDAGFEPRTGVGSGVIVQGGLVLTAAHVVAGAEVIVVRTHDGEILPADPIFSESRADIALLRLRSPMRELPGVVLGDSDRLAVGQRAYAIGSPYGLRDSLSVGHISGFRDFGQLYNGTVRAEFIQTDAAINSGNSGGPVFNSQGEVIGIASRILTVSGGFQGLGFVVAINTAKQLMAFDGRPWTGIEGVFLDHRELANLLNLDLQGGVLVLHVAPGSPADKAGLRGGSIPARVRGQDIPLGGDLILELGGQETCHSACLVEAHAHLAGLDHIDVTYLRAGKTVKTVIDVSAARASFGPESEASSTMPNAE